jgi:hypothetical protein
MPCKHTTQQQQQQWMSSYASFAARLILPECTASTSQNYQAGRVLKLHDSHK